MRIAIIGAGLAGLTTAWELHRSRPELELEVFEATERIGGKLLTVPFASGPTDMGAEAYLAFRHDATEFFTELGLADALRRPSGLPSAFYAQGGLHAMPANTVMGIPASSAGCTELFDAATCHRIDTEQELPGIAWSPDGPDVSLGALIRERYGDQVVDRVVSALQGGVYSSLSDDLGVRATVPELARAFDEMSLKGQKVTLSGAIADILQRRKARNAELSYTPDVFASFEGGYAQVYEALAEQSQAKIYLEAFVTGIERDDTGFVLKGAGEGHYDAVIVTTPAPTAALLLRTLVPAATPLLRSIQLASSVVVGMKFATDQGLPEHSGILVAADEPDVRAKAFTFSSRKWPHLGARGGALVRASFGRFGDDALTRADEDALVDLALDDLHTITGFDGRQAGLDEIYVQRWFGGLPVYGPQHLATVSAVQEELANVSGVYATGAWDAGVGVPAVIAAARRQAQVVLEELS
ncbi:protoporphyrinogen oxidase [Corynebacterium sp. HS2168-gen11]|uniref:protoporphyrinogen oxidase n=1 Tax=Corynebacterium sp. HS2168-gen11 TaxID=2974027 RepID=UPI00216B3622|nr:protoporphyrinogen oxidase [Corynebacterium sp. HS2168-gen11]MCS4535762.1 protoporphyrinogen oxidase [Corynebacterium sp. HS2168-gen11]